jgi:hypothetical protein
MKMQISRESCSHSVIFSSTSRKDAKWIPLNGFSADDRDRLSFAKSAACAQRIAVMQRSVDATMLKMA